MAGEEYVVGVIVKPSGAVTGALLQAGNVTVQADEYEAKDADGNTADRKTLNHRLLMHTDFIVAKNDLIPVQGDIVSFVGVTSPTVSSAGVVTGAFSVGGTATVSARVLGDVTVNSSNGDYVQGSFEAVRDLVNGLP